MSKPSVIWGCINIGTMDRWYPLCVDYMLQCDIVPRLAVVLEIDPIPIAVKRDIQQVTDGKMKWVFVAHGLKHIKNINNDNARNLRFLVPMMGEIARPDDLLALIEQDVLLMKTNWVQKAHELLQSNMLVSAAGAYNGMSVAGRQNRAKPYFSIFKSGDYEQITEDIKTNRGSYVTLNTPDDIVYRLDKQRIVTGRSHAFGSEDVWGIHARAGSNHNGSVDKSLDAFSKTVPAKLRRKIIRKW